MGTIVDLGHEIYDGMPAYPGLPAARVQQLVTHKGSRERYRHQAEFALTSMTLAGNTGTYLDSPWHRYADAYDISGIPLERVADLPGIVVDATPAPDGKSVEANFDPGEVRGAAVLIRTGWSERWGTEEYWSGGPYLAQATIDALVGAQPSVVGVDFSNVDDPNDPERPAHTRLLDADILIVEHLTNLDPLPPEGFRFSCVPLKVRGAASISVRPWAVAPPTSQ